MEEPREVAIRRVLWWEIFPWLRLVRAAIVALSLRVLVLAIAGLLLVEAGRQALEYAFPHREPLPALPRGVPLSLGGVDLSLAQPVQNRVGTSRSSSSRARESASLLTELARQPRLVPVFGVWADLASCYTYFLQITYVPDRPGMPRAIRLERSWPDWIKRLCYLIWVFAVWTLCGGVIVRFAALAALRGEGHSRRGMVRFAVRRWPAAMACVLGGWVAIYAFGWISAVICLVASWFGTHVLPLGWAWVITVIPGALLTLVVVLVVLGWPLMLAAIMIDNQDGYGAVGAAGSYLFRRPFHFLFYAFVAAVIGAVVAAVVALFVEWCMGLTLWSAGLVLPRVSFGELLSSASLAQWHDVFRHLTSAYLYAQFWTSTAVAYVLLRYNVDQTELDELHDE
ncbi:MAG: hypothetical protein H5U08_07725 [Thermogutta sp.]|uniref:hypothetical protein n=1 Tax=Thermogutta sp. TaxID=1962930 RepID=UPI00199A86C2|nr:hypothetical protein [Thermogutta sp.]MBC7352232.1 hypothetical protein [Thermogutta sp.]